MLVLSLVLASLSLVSAVYTPQSRHLHARHAAIINARAPIPAPVPAPAPPPVLKKRSSKKCRARPASSSAAPSSSPVAPANPGADPTHSSQQQQQPAPTQAPPPPQTHKPSPTTTAHPQTTTHPSGGGGGGGSSGGSDPFGGFHAGTNQGDITFYELGLTACGQTFTDGDLVAAASQLLFDKVPGQNGNPNDNPVCGKRVNVHLNGNTVNVAIVDRCVACAADDLDLSPTAFLKLAPLAVGRAHGATWEWA